MNLWHFKLVHLLEQPVLFITLPTFHKIRPPIKSCAESAAAGRKSLLLHAEVNLRVRVAVTFSTNLNFSGMFTRADCVRACVRAGCRI